MQVDFIDKQAQTKSNSLTILEFEDYRDYLSHLFKELKLKNSKISFQYLAKKVGVTKGYINLVFLKKRHLGPNNIAKLAIFFKLSNFEFQYFYFSVLKKTTQDKDTLLFIDSILSSYKAGFSSQKKSQFTELNIDKNDHIFRNWIVTAIVCLSSAKDFQMEAQWIHQKLGGKTVLSLEEVNEALEKILFLIGEEDFKKVSQTRTLYRDPHPTNINEHQRFKTGLARAALALDLKGKTDIHRPNRFQQYMFLLNQSEIRKIIELCDKFEKDILNVVNTSTGGDRLLMVSNNIFGLSN